MCIDRRDNDDMGYPTAPGACLDKKMIAIAKNTCQRVDSVCANMQTDYPELQYNVKAANSMLSHS